jgi:heptosyltransferase-2
MINDKRSMLRVVGKRTIDKSEINRILVRATNWVGDVVMNIPALEAVRENFPQSTITVLARPWVIPLLENHPAVDQVLPFQKGKGFLSHMAEIIRVVGMIRKMRYDLAILFQNAFEAGLLAWLGGVKFRVGYNTDGRRFLLSHAVIRNEEVLKLHQVEYYLSILRAMDWEAKTKDPSLYIAEKDSKAIQSLLSSHGIKPKDLVLGLSPGAVYGSAKRWPPGRFANIADWAVQRWRAKVVLMGSGGEKVICRMVNQSMKHTALNLCGETKLGEAMALIKRCYFFVTNDSGLMHVAAALDVPTVAIFGSTDPMATGPRSPKASIVQHEIDCAPCLKPECPDDFRCMLEIEPDEVWKEMEEVRGNLI